MNTFQRLQKTQRDGFNWTSQAIASISEWIKKGVTGSQRSLGRYAFGTSSFSSRGTDFDLEIREFPIRDRVKATQILEILEYCPEAALAIEIYKTDVRSSADGDDQGFTIGDFQPDGKTPVDPNIKAVGLELFERVYPVSLQDLMISDAIGRGDHFQSLCFGREGLSKKSTDMSIASLLRIPPYETFRLEENNGDLIGFEQRRTLTQSSPDCFWNPAQMVHLRYRRESLYGQSMWAQSLWNWQEYKRSREEFAIGRRALALNPRIHTMPTGVKGDYAKAYKADLDEKVKNGSEVITDYVMLNGGAIASLGQGDSGLTQLMNALMMERTAMIMPTQIPSWRFSGFQSNAAQDYVGQPALAWVRTVNGVRALLGEAISQVFDTELILKFGGDWYLKNAKGKYRIVFPSIQTSLTPPAPPTDGSGITNGIADVSGDRVKGRNLETELAWENYKQEKMIQADIRANRCDREKLVHYVESHRQNI